MRAILGRARAGSISRSTIAAAQPRRRRSRTQIYRAMGSVEVEDQEAGALVSEAALCRSGKIATYGWSYGGYMTLKLLEKAPRAFTRRGLSARR